MRPKREPARHNQQTYMITSETWGRRSLFRAEGWARLLIETLYHYTGSVYELHAFVVMPDHFHALTTPTGALERAVQYIKGGFSHRAKAELGSNLEVWQKGFSDHRVRDAADYDKHVSYIHLNPIRKHLCESAEEYPYSSAHPGFILDEVPQRLKPLSRAAACGAAEAAPFQNKDKRETAEAAPFQNKEKRETAEAAPFQNKEKRETAEAASFQNKEKRETAEAASSQNKEKRETAEAAPFQNKEKRETAEAASSQGSSEETK